MQVITRINYGQSVSISGLAGGVSLAGSGGGLWAVEGGNWQMSSGLINRSDVSLYLHEEVESISHLDGHYELNTTKGNSYTCDVTVVATPLDEINIQFTPPVSVPERKLQHTHATFVRGLLNPVSNLAATIFADLSISLYICPFLFVLVLSVRIHSGAYSNPWWFCFNQGVFWLW